MAASSNWSARLTRRSASSRTCQKAGSASRTPVGAVSCRTANRFSPDIQRISSGCLLQWRNSADNCVAASASTLRSAPQSKTHGKGICKVAERRRATLSMSRISGHTQPTSWATLPEGGRSWAAASATASDTSLGIENHCGADQPNWWAYSPAKVSKRCCWPVARYRSNNTSQVSACCERVPPGPVNWASEFSH